MSDKKNFVKGETICLVNYKGKFFWIPKVTYDEMVKDGQIKNPDTTTGSMTITAIDPGVT